jgi:hypothetical protein
VRFCQLATAPVRHQPGEQILVLLQNDRLGKLVAVLVGTPLGQRAGQGGFVQCTVDLGSATLDVVDWEQQTIVLMFDQPGRACARRRDDGGAGRPGFEYDIAKGLEAGGEETEIGKLEELANVLAQTEELYTLGDALRPCQGFQFAAKLAVARDQQGGIRDLCQGPDRRVLRLFRMQAPQRQ